MSIYLNQSRRFSKQYVCMISEATVVHLVKIILELVFILDMTRSISGEICPNEVHH